ncbi:cellulose-growth-specific protein [Crepidotus variabilis]|uniref:AA9 family lytic polysaccharide monooxygenase n=1 Tax=Crepidotus variabilis TaxID=179855 RepID=A0A9P6EQ59_9AGAR|nr:cellulose-growth-specific protein [Crepidotus variabilis]
MLSASLAVLASFLVSQAAAHGGVTSYVIGGTTYAGWQPYNSASGQSSIERPYSTYDPILSVSSGSLSCNDNGQASGSQLSATVAAGSTITAKWSQWTHAQGPVMVYMAKCPSTCSTANSNSLDWFKIDEKGLISGNLPNGQWGTALVMKDLAWTSTIPASLAAGEYLIRHELLALHQANTPQFYPECGQLKVTGGGGKVPGSGYTVKFPGGYGANDPGVNINIYATESQTITTYKVPGPPVWNGQ